MTFCFVCICSVFFRCHLLVDVKMVCIFQDVSHTVLVCMDQHWSCFRLTEWVFLTMRLRLLKLYVTLQATQLELLENGTLVRLYIDLSNSLFIFQVLSR